MEHMRY